jgi:hypothetical protein
LSTKPAPTNERPYHQANQTGDEMRLWTTNYYLHRFRQIGWHGHSGAFYALDEDPSRHEPAGFAPLEDLEPVGYQLVSRDEAAGTTR